LKGRKVGESGHPAARAWSARRAGSNDAAVAGFLARGVVRKTGLAAAKKAPGGQSYKVSAFTDATLQDPILQTWVTTPAL
jgi:hypothetical protein